MRNRKTQRRNARSFEFCRAVRCAKFSPSSEERGGVRSCFLQTNLYSRALRAFSLWRRILNRVNPRFPVDLLAPRPDDTARRYREGDPLIREALDHGQVLHERNVSGMAALPETIFCAIINSMSAQEIIEQIKGLRRAGASHPVRGRVRQLLDS